MFLLLVTDGTRALQNTLVRWGQIVEAAEHGARGRQPPGLPLEGGGLWATPAPAWAALSHRCGAWGPGWREQDAPSTPALQPRARWRR